MSLAPRTSCGSSLVSTARIRRAWRGYTHLVHDRNPSFNVPLGGSYEADPYMEFYVRARVRQFRDDARVGNPPVNARGYPVYLGWDRLTGLPRGEPFEDSREALGGRVWVSSDRASPGSSAIADARFWRGDSPASWGGAFPDDQRWPRVTYPDYIPPLCGG